MELLTQPNNQVNVESETSFDREARESYFEMLEVALSNLSIVDRKKKDGIIRLQK
jgi:hypothetical protein